MVWAAVFFVLALFLAKSLYQAFATGTIGVRASTYHRNTEPGAFWLTAILHLALLVVALTVAAMSLRHSR